MWHLKLVILASLSCCWAQQGCQRLCSPSKLPPQLWPTRNVKHLKPCPSWSSMTFHLCKVLCTCDTWSEKALLSPGVLVLVGSRSQPRSSPTHLPPFTLDAAHWIHRFTSVKCILGGYPKTLRHALSCATLRPDNTKSSFLRWLYLRGTFDT